MLILPQPTHHHIDHTMGLMDYVNVGAKVIIVDNAVDYYTAIPRESMLTFT
jgi:glyoxylase-like metal-dependent hydrolase (beta-lactamase superfamily II)